MIVASVVVGGAIGIAILRISKSRPVLAVVLWMVLGFAAIILPFTLFAEFDVEWHGIAFVAPLCVCFVMFEMREHKARKGKP